MSARALFIALTALLVVLLSNSLAYTDNGHTYTLNGPVTLRKASATKIGHALLELSQEYAEFQVSGAAEPFKPGAHYLRISNNQVVIDAIAAEDASLLLSDMEALGLQNGAAFGRVVSGRLPLSAIQSMEGIDSLKFVRASMYVTSNGRATSQGDPAMRSDLARESFGVNGSGVTVGVISDSYNCLGGALDSVNSEDLPGYLDGAGDDVSNRMDGDCSLSIDEGRAMMELIHDVAPGANQAFHTGNGGQANFARGILDLATEADADVIVDDIIYPHEPMFQDGIIAQAVNEAVNAHSVAYFSAAGNAGDAAYESDWRNGDPLTINTPQGSAEYILHDFNPGSDQDSLQSVTIPEGSGMLLALQWDQPFASTSPNSPGSANDVDIFLFRSGSTDVLDILTLSDAPNIGADPFEMIGFFNPPGSGETEFDIAIGKYLSTGGQTPDPGFIKYVVLQGTATINEYGTASGTVYGHAAANGAQAVGAAFYGDTPAFGTSPPVRESFSSIGPVPILFDASGNRISEVRDKPEIVAPDGTNTTFFIPGNDIDGDGFPNFPGTSAAAPHAAAVAALMLEANPDLTPDEIYSALENTAIDMHTSGFDDHTGHGLIEACEALKSVASGSCASQQELPEAPEPTAPSGEIATTTPEFIWTSVENATMYDLQVDNLTDDIPEAIRETELTENTFTPSTPLEDQKSYRWQVRAGNDNGWSPWSEPVEFNINVTDSVQDVCDDSWIQIGIGPDTLGCIQGEEANDSDGLSWEEATSYCFTNYGGRLPTTSEWYIAMAHHALSDEDDNWEWNSDFSGTADAHAASGGGDGGINSQHGFSDSTENAFRCWTTRIDSSS